MKKIERILLNFFQSTNYSNEYLKYGVWFKRIKFIVGTRITNYEIKKIFNVMVNKNLFNKKKNIKRSYLYQFKKKGFIDKVYETISFE